MNIYIPSKGNCVSSQVLHITYMWPLWWSSYKRKSLESWWDKDIDIDYYYGKSMIIMNHDIIGEYVLSVVAVM